jgi:hypothetical protein
MKCKSGDVFDLLVDKVADVAMKVGSWVANEMTKAIEPILCGLSWGVACNLPDYCWSVQKNVYGRCTTNVVNQDALDFLLGCSFGKDAKKRSVPMSKRCFFDRQKQVCIGRDDGERDSGAYTRYQSLFTAPSKNELEAEFKQIAGDTFDVRLFPRPAPPLQRDPTSPTYRSQAIPPTLQSAFDQLQKECAAPSVFFS